MYTVMGRCLTHEEIEFQAQASIPRDAIVERHLKVCEECRSALAQEQLFDEVRNAVRGDFQDPLSRLPILGRGELSELDDVPTPGYRIVGELHRGGQGVVFRAIQLATQRTVALKLLLAGRAASAQQLVRFQREIDIAASLSHPNIVTIYDGGSFDGRHYLAMEYVDGCRLDKFVGDHTQGSDATKRELSINQRVRLFHKIAVAVGYAHLRGVMHRDLKPSNIIVDRDGEPHVLDFGLAKLSESEITDGHQSPTISGEFLGTLAYASPEQTHGNPKFVDIRTDVYSLGVILYEMLTGKLPYDVSAPLSETLNNICQSAPVRPTRLTRQIDDELETIVLKALAKEPSRRYQSGEHLARDLDHYLNDQPIDAKRDSSWYLLRKSIRHYRTAVLTVLALMGVVVGALVVTLASLQRAMEQRNVAMAATRDADFARVQELAARRSAEDRRTEAETHRREAEFQAYVANVAAADGALAQHDVVEAWERLQSAPENLRGWEWSRLFHELDHSRMRIDTDTAAVAHIAISPDGRFVASCSTDPFVNVWDAESGKLVAKIEGPARASIAFSPSGEHLIIGWWSGVIHFWNIKTRASDRTLAGPTNGIDDLTCSPDGTMLAASFHAIGQPGQPILAYVWHLSDGEVVQRFTLDYWHITDMAFSPDGESLAMIRFDGGSVWDIGTGELRSRLTDQPGAEHCIAWSFDGLLIATGGADNQIHVWDARSGQHRFALAGHSGAVRAVRFGPTNGYLYSGARDKTIRAWNIKSQTVSRVWHGHQRVVSDLAINADDSRMLSGSGDGTVRIWDAIPNRAPNMLLGHSAQVNTIAFSPDGRLCATASWDQSVRIWDLAARRQIAVLTHDAPMHGVAFSPDGKQLATCGWNGLVKVWDAIKHHELAVLQGHAEGSRVHSVAYAPGGDWFVTGSSDDSLRIWNAHDHKLITVLHGHSDHIHTVTISADGKWLASAGHQSVVVWDAKSFVQQRSFPRRMEQDDFSLAFHSNNIWLAAGSDLGEMTVWDVVSGKPVRKLSGHTDEIHSVAFAPDGTRIASAAFDGKVKLWEVKSGRELANLTGLESPAITLAFSPDGRTLLAGLQNGQVKIWQAAEPVQSSPTN